MVAIAERLSPQVAQCAGESTKDNDFCPQAQSQVIPDNRICEACLKLNKKFGSEDLTMEEFRLLNPDINLYQAVGIIAERLRKQDELPATIPRDPTPLKSIHERLSELPTIYRQEILERHK